MMNKSLRKRKINALLTAIVIFVSVVAVGIIYAPRIIGYQVYSVDTGSMEPTIKKGSLIYVKQYINFEDYKINDIVTFSDMTRENSFTHRIVDIDVTDRCFTTKGDANTDNDLTPADFINAVGKVEFAVPYIGYAALFFRNKYAMIAVALIYIGWAAIEIEVFLAERKKRDE